MRCSLTFEFADPATASCVLGAVMPEQATAPSRRARVRLARRGRSLSLRIEARDITSMRAAINSYLRWLILAERIIRAVGDD